MATDPVYYAKYKQYVRTFADNVFTTAKMNELFDKYTTLITPYVNSIEKEVAPYTNLTNNTDAGLLACCAPIAASTWADALDELAIHGVVDGISQRSGTGRMVGFAVTARHQVGELGEFDKGDFGVGQLVAACGPGRVLMVDMAGAPISTLGGLASYAASRRQATGVVIDGGCRDVDEIRATGLWLASRCVTPRTGKRRLRLLPADRR